MAGLALPLCFTVAEARPVTYPGGSMSMTEIDGDAIATQVDHTLSRTVAVGVYALTESDGDRVSAGVLGNFLVARKNTEDSQANIYLLGSLGPSWVREEGMRGRDTKLSGTAGIEADWETRRLFVGASAKVSVVGDDTQAGWRTRLGVAPYVANSGALHTWLMVQAGRAPIPGRKTEVTPLVRLFTGQILAEAGVSHRGRGFGTLWFYF